MKLRDELNAGLKTAYQICKAKKNNGKYLQISNCIFTMKGWTDKKIILRCFFTTGLFCLHEKFQVYQSSPSRFSFKKCIFLLYLWGKYFSCKIFTVLHQSKKSYLIWTKNEHKLSNYFQKISTPNCNGGLHSAV